MGAIHINPKFEILAVITQPDKPSGRSQKLMPTPIKTFAESLGLSVMTPSEIKNNKELENFAKKLSPDFTITVSYGQIIPKSILEIPKIASINIHGSLLPKYRGASPIQTALLNGDKETGITMMEMNEKMDGGDIFLLKRIPIENEDDFNSLSKKLSMLAGEITPHALIDIAEESLKKIEQDNSRATYSKKIEKEDGEINCKKMTAEEALRRVKAFSVWPECYIKWNGKTLKILKAAMNENTAEMQAGTMTLIDKNTLAIACKKELLIPMIVQLEGKKTTPVKEFINGYRGEILKHPTVE